MNVVVKHPYEIKGYTSLFQEKSRVVYRTRKQDYVCWPVRLILNAQFVSRV